MQVIKAQFLCHCFRKKIFVVRIILHKSRIESLELRNVIKVMCVCYSIFIYASTIVHYGFEEKTYCKVSVFYNPIIKYSAKIEIYQKISEKYLFYKINFIKP